MTGGNELKENLEGKSAAPPKKDFTESLVVVIMVNQPRILLNQNGTPMSGTLLYISTISFCRGSTFSVFGALQLIRSRRHSKNLLCRLPNFTLLTTTQCSESGTTSTIIILVTSYESIMLHLSCCFCFNRILLQSLNWMQNSIGIKIHPWHI